MAVDGSKKSVIAAIIGNTIVCIAKFIGFGMTGSGAMLSEAIHTVADLLNQGLLFFGIIQSAKKPDPLFPFGYAKERFVWALVSAVGIFFLGCGVTIYHGIHSLMDPSHEIKSPEWAVGVLLFSLVLEGIVLWIAGHDLYRQSRTARMPFMRFCRIKADPSAVAVLLEDSAACAGVLIALASFGLTWLTGETYWDGIGSISIGILLGFVAIWLIQRNREILVGSAIPREDQAAIQETLKQHPAVEEVEELRTRVEDASRYTVNLSIDFDGRAIATKLTPFLEKQFEPIQNGDFPHFQEFAGNFAEAIIDELGEQVQDLENKIREAVPQATHVDIEPQSLSPKTDSPTKEIS